jgi:dTMP kinase
MFSFSKYLKALSKAYFNKIIRKFNSAVYIKPESHGTRLKPKAPFALTYHYLRNIMAKNKKGFFITFEGPDGSGKTTHIKLLYDYLTAKSLSCVCTREPGGTKVGEKLRDILKDTSLNGLLSIQTEVLLLQTARAQHVYEVIKPALKDNKIVLCDRYADSSTAYQGVASDVGKEIICGLNNFSTSGLVPDLTILLDIPPKRGLKRADDREPGEVKDRWEEQNVSFHQKVRKAFHDLAEENPDRYRTVSAVGPIEEVHQRILNIIKKELF